MTIMVLPWIMWINHYFTMDESIRTTRWTVSYTHLDVYKRQDGDMPIVR